MSHDAWLLSPGENNQVEIEEEYNLIINLTEIFSDLLKVKTYLTFNLIYCIMKNNNQITYIKIQEASGSRKRYIFCSPLALLQLAIDMYIIKE